MPSSAALLTTLSDITSIDARILALLDQVDELRDQREALEQVAIKELTTRRLDGFSAAGRVWWVAHEQDGMDDGLPCDGDGPVARRLVHMVERTGARQ